METAGTELKASHDLLKGAAGSSPDTIRTFETMDQGFCITEKLDAAPGEPSDGRSLEANPAFLRRPSLPDPVGRTIRDLIQGIGEEIMDRYDRVVRTGRPERFEACVSALDLWVNAEASPPREAGQITVLFSNISVRRCAAAALRESEERQAFLLKLSDGLRPLTDPAAIQKEATRTSGEHLKVDRASYVELDEARQVATVRRNFTQARVRGLSGRTPARPSEPPANACDRVGRSPSTMWRRSFPFIPRTFRLIGRSGSAPS